MCKNHRQDCLHAFCYHILVVSQGGVYTATKMRLYAVLDIQYSTWYRYIYFHISLSSAYVNIVEGVEVVTQTVLSMRPLLKDDDIKNDDSPGPSTSFVDYTWHLR